MQPVLDTPPKVAEPSDPGISEEEHTAISVTVARMAARWTPVNEAKAPVVRDWLSDKDVLAWLHNKLYHNEIGELLQWEVSEGQ